MKHLFMVMCFQKRAKCTFSTVGLGDTVPSNPDMMLANFLLIIVGLSLLSMCINLIQVTEFVFWQNNSLRSLILAKAGRPSP